MEYKVEFTHSAQQDLRNLPKNIAQRIIQKLEAYVTTGQPLSFAKRLNNYEIGDYRFRIGDYRAVVRIRDQSIIVTKVGHRKNVYEG